MKGFLLSGLPVALAVGICGVSAAAAENGAKDEIRIGQTLPYSGPLSSFGTIGRLQQAYFDWINAEGGINGHKIRFLSLDDAYSPPKTVEQVVLGLPSTRRCLSRRAFSIHLRLPQGSTVRSATVSVDGHRVAVRSGAKLTAPVNLKGLPRGKYTVKIVLRLAAGKTITGTRRYRTCAPTHR